ncbi:MAG TPA: TetR family transcriptional regulator [Candidatus Dormibacteraeota bacterium]|nr:TetR family transcriptional regulator [Candidatus Dormibacteraeota bacterium]
MEPLSPEEEKQRGLTRERLVQAALELINEEGLEALSMRGLADRLEVKAASLYWHVRDRRELLELLADGILEGVGRPPRCSTWRETVVAIGEALGKTVAANKDAGRVLLDVPGALTRSDTYSDLKSQLQYAGLQAGEAGEVALMVMTRAITAPVAAEKPIAPGVAGGPASIAIDSGSRGVILRAGPPDMQALIRVPPDQGGAAPAVMRGEQVVVRRLRGVGRGELELNPRRPWKFKVQAPTWNTVLDVAGLDVREIWVDSGAANLECFLPLPHGVVPVHISSGVVNVSIHRPREAAVTAVVHTGAVKLKLDDYSTKVAVFDVHWQSDGAIGSRDRYELDVSSGVVDFRLDLYVPRVRPPEGTPAVEEPSGRGASALDILLDGVEARAKNR